MAHPPHILFVDDEENILKGLRRGLRSRRADWKMTFACGPHEALDILEQDAPDIIITDMRMPEINGAKLLEIVQQKIPDCARLILSGYAEDEAILKAVGPAQQYLAKPCDFGVIEETIDRLLTLRAQIKTSEIRTLIGAQQTLPSLPDIYQKIITELQNPLANNHTIAKLIAQDLGFSAQVLKICNSAFFGLPQTVTDLETAISMLGLETLRSLTLLQGVFCAFEGRDEMKILMERLCAHCAEIGILARRIGEQCGLSPQECQMLFCAGTLSHIGTLILALYCPEAFAQATQLADVSARSIADCEHDILGADHAMVGAYFLGLWGFPLAVSEAVAFHHHPQDCNEANHKMIAILHFSQQLCKALGAKRMDLALLEENLDTAFLKKAGIQMSFEGWRKIIEEQNTETGG